MSLHRFGVEADSARVDRQIRSVLFRMQETGEDWSTVGPQVAALIASLNLGEKIVRQSSAFSGNRQINEDLAVELDMLIYERIVNPNYGSSFEPHYCMNGASAVGWASMLMMRSAVYIARNLTAQTTRMTPTDEIGEVLSTGKMMFGPTDSPDPAIWQHPSRQSTSRPEGSTHPSQRAHDRRTHDSRALADRAAEAEQMIAAMGRGLSAQERKGVVVLGLGWYLGLPYPWPQQHQVTRWVENNVDGPLSASKAIRGVIDAQASGEDHPLSPMFEGWPSHHLSDLLEADQMMTFAWLTGAAAPRPGPARSLRRKVAAAAVALDPANPVWSRKSRVLIRTLAAAMSGADRAFGSKELAVRSDEANVNSKRMMWMAANAVALCDGPLGSHPSEVVSRAITLLINVQYEEAMEREWNNVIAS